ncbi:SMI1/KNR4 family protein [Myxococcus qinghaiensis]|uniref:SMI1/KNR4 family protein n=1 Tax=Myxococcus qinghaiensis TaxID=2906758 RepID=UPI0020A8202D|nr:SMI1/KNR4 family protein [Myxococcus qinghaiensis]MCP3166993.1 SMI1/KNR4 family protein [Myxococcus qinghaiensis]
MSTVIETIEALNARLTREKELPLESVRITPVSAKELLTLERELGKQLPASYLWFITEHGLFSATDFQGQERSRMLSP